MTLNLAWDLCSALIYSFSHSARHFHLSSKTSHSSPTDPHFIANDLVGYYPETNEIISRKLPQNYYHIYIYTFLPISSITLIYLVSSLFKVGEDYYLPPILPPMILSYFTNSRKDIALAIFPFPYHQALPFLTVS